MSDEVQEAKNREEAFVSHVEGKPSSSRLQKTSLKFKKTKKRAPLFVLVVLLAIGIGLVFASQSLLPFAIINRFREEYNTVGFSSTLRSDALLDTQLSDSSGPLALSKLQRNSFLQSEITPVDFSIGSSSPTALVFEKSRGKYSAVVSDSVLDNNSSSDIISAINSALTEGNIKVNDSLFSTESAKSIGAFQDKYISASKIWRGGNSGWYDTIEKLTEARLAITRTRFANYSVLALNSGTKDVWKKLASGNYKATDGGISSYGSFSEVDENGKEIITTNSGTVDSESLTAQTTAEGVRNALNSKVASVAKLAATAGCVGVEIGTSIYTILSVQQTLQKVNYFTGFAESVQAVQIDESNGEPMNNYVELLTKKDPETKKSAMESADAAALFSGSSVNFSDDGIKSTNAEGLLSSLGTLSDNINLTAEAFERCSYVRMGVATANFATTIMNFVPVLGQASMAIHFVAKTIGKIALGVAVGTIVSFIIPRIIDHVVDSVINNIATDWTGPKLFSALSSGASKVLGGNAQTGGSSPASRETLQAYYRAQEAVLAEQADYERRTLSPLDISSGNTFLGSIVYGLIPFATSTSIGGIVKSFGTTLKNSLNSILPSASAIAETDMITSIGSCPYLESVGMIGDAHCDPYFVTDVSTISDSYEENMQKALSFDSENFTKSEETGEIQINPNSNLGKKITVCDQRVASFGIPDANAANLFAKHFPSLLANTPLIGDVAQIVSAASEAENMPWISGEACGLSNENPYYEEIKTYGRLTDDWRLLKNAGVIEETPVEKYLAAYYEENPLDNSYEGVLARYSGMTKEDVVATLDYIDALTYIANYNPKERLDFEKSYSDVLESYPQVSKIYSEAPSNISPVKTASSVISKSYSHVSESYPQELKTYSQIELAYGKIKDNGRQFEFVEKRRIFRNGRECKLLA